MYTYIYIHIYVYDICNYMIYATTNYIYNVYVFIYIHIYIYIYVYIYIYSTLFFIHIHNVFVYERRQIELSQKLTYTAVCIFCIRENAIFQSITNKTQGPHLNTIFCQKSNLFYLAK